MATMIKAKELAWFKLSNLKYIAQSEMGEFRIEWDATGYNIFLVKDNFYLKKDFPVSTFLPEKIKDQTFKTLEEAKASCQAHYQQMVESMVDMGAMSDFENIAFARGYMKGREDEREEG